VKSAPSHSFVFSWEMMVAPALPKRSFEPVWSQWQCVLKSVPGFAPLAN
jgi:hypothetical protein